MSTFESNPALPRRAFLAAVSLTPLAPLAAEPHAPALPGEALTPTKTLGGLRQESGPAPVDGAIWYVADAPGDGFQFAFPAGYLAKFHSLGADMLVDGNTMVVFALQLQEGDQGRRFRLSFSALNQCSFRMRMALSLVDQNRWLVEREGAFLKPLCGGDRVDLDKVDRAVLTVTRKAPHIPARFCMTRLHASPVEVPRIAKPILPKGPLLDELGQSRLHDWPGKTRSVEEMKQRLQSQLADAPRRSWPQDFSRWGGWKSKKLGEGTGFFRTQKADGRWWLVDPDGYAFWSAGLDNVRVDCEARYDGIEAALSWMPPNTGEFADIYKMTVVRRLSGQYINYLAANCIRAFGASGWRDKWATIALGEMKRLRFNTVANWSEWNYAAKAQFPYVRPMSFRGRRVPLIYRDFPDVFHSGFEADARITPENLAAPRRTPHSWATFS